MRQFAIHGWGVGYVAECELWVWQAGRDGNDKHAMPANGGGVNVGQFAIGSQNLGSVFDRQDAFAIGTGGN